VTASQASRHFHIVLHLGYGIPRTLPEILSDLCQSDTAGCALEQGIPEYPFKTPDLLAKRRLRHPQLDCRLAEV
jgi:hypothetical protein